MKDTKYRSSRLVSGDAQAGVRAYLKGCSVCDEDMRKPFIGIVNSFNKIHQDIFILGDWLMLLSIYFPVIFL